MFKALSEFQSIHWYCNKCESMVQEMLKVSQEDMNFSQSMITTIEKSIASCFEMASENLTALFKQQLAKCVCVAPH